MSVVEKQLGKPEYAKVTYELKLKVCKEAVRDILDVSDSSSQSKDSKRAKKSRH